MTSLASSSSSQLPARRRADLLEFIRQQGQATVVELSETFNVSLDTVRRDLDHLSGLGSVNRTHGGAIPVRDLPAVDTPFTARLGANAEAKNRIAAVAARYVGDGQTLVVNGGTTTLAIMPHLADRTGLRIITNNLLIPQQVPDSCYREMRFVGGDIRERSWVTLGERGADGQKLHLPSNPDAKVTSIIGVGSVSNSGGLGTSDEREASLMQEMIHAGDRVVVLADSSKFGRGAYATVCQASDFQVFVTDAPLPAEAARAFAEAGVDVVIA